MDSKVLLATCVAVATAVAGVFAAGAAAQGGGAARPATGPKKAAQQRVPSGLVGTWFWGTVSPTRYVDSRTGEFVGNGGGGGVTYVFKADGTYQCFVVIDFGAMFPGESTQTWHEGTIKVDEATRTITLKTNKGQVTSIKGSTQKRRAFAGPELGTRQTTYTFEAGEDGTPYLRLADKKNPEDKGQRYVRDTGASKG